MLENFYRFEMDTSGQEVGFVLWHGLVEDIFDPLKLHRVRARIVGFHNLDRIKMPTETLPWATVIKSAVGANQTSSLQIGDWVTGYFLDGANAQQPTILGKYDGIRSDRIDKFYRRTEPRSAAAEALYPVTLAELTEEQKKMLRSYPKPATNIKYADRPTIPLLGQGLPEGTAVDIANKKRVHVCDISQEMRKAASLARLAFSTLMQGIRAGIRAILKALGFSPESESSRFIEIAKKVLRGIKWLQSVIDDIKDAAAVLVYYAKIVRAMIDWILSLPKAIADFLAKCLNELLASLGSGFSALTDITGVSDLTSSIKVVSDIAEASKKLANDTVGLLNVPVQVVDALTTPSTPSTQDAAAGAVATFVSKFSTTNNPTIDISRP